MVGIYSVDRTEQRGQGSLKRTGFIRQAKALQEKLQGEMEPMSYKTRPQFRRNRSRSRDHLGPRLGNLTYHFVNVLPSKQFYLVATKYS